MLHIKFQASKPSCSEEEFFLKYFSMYFCGPKLGLLARGHFGPWDLHLNKLGRGALGNATYQISNTWAKWVQRRVFEYISMHFYGSNIGLPGAGHLGSWYLQLFKIGKGPLGNATY